MSKIKRDTPKVRKTEQPRSRKPSDLIEGNPFPDWNGRVPLPSNVDEDSLVQSSKTPSKIIH